MVSQSHTSLGAQVQAAITDRGWTHEAVANVVRRLFPQSRIDRTTVWRLCHTNRPAGVLLDYRQRRHLRQIAVALGLPPAHFEPPIRAGGSTFGDQVFAARTARAWTQVETAQRVRDWLTLQGVRGPRFNPSSISRLESDPTYTLLPIYVDALRAVLTIPDP